MSWLVGPVGPVGAVGAVAEQQLACWWLSRSRLQHDLLHSQHPPAPASGWSCCVVRWRIVTGDAACWCCGPAVVLLGLSCSTHVNVVSGSNGSGKSAVLQAMQCCLGVKARSTGRGDNLKQFIKSGEHDATVKVRAGTPCRCLQDCPGPGLTRCSFSAFQHCTWLMLTA